MALHELARRNYSGKSPVSIKYQNLHSFKEYDVRVSLKRDEYHIYMVSSIYNPFKYNLQLWFWYQIKLSFLLHCPVFNGERYTLLRSLNDNDCKLVKLTNSFLTGSLIWKEKNSVLMQPLNTFLWASSFVNFKYSPEVLTEIPYMFYWHLLPIIFFFTFCMLLFFSLLPEHLKKKNRVLQKTKIYRLQINQCQTIIFWINNLM